MRGSSSVHSAEEELTLVLGCQRDPKDAAAEFSDTQFQRAIKLDGVRESDSHPTCGGFKTDESQRIIRPQDCS